MSSGGSQAHPCFKLMQKRASHFVSIAKGERWTDKFVNEGSAVDDSLAVPVKKLEQRKKNPEENLAA